MNVASKRISIIDPKIIIILVFGVFIFISLSKTCILNFEMRVIKRLVSATTSRVPNVLLTSVSFDDLLELLYTLLFIKIT